MHEPSFKKKKNKGLTFVFLSVCVTVTLSPGVLSIENILAFSIISYLFGWPLFAPKRQEITKKGSTERHFFSSVLRGLWYGTSVSFPQRWGILNDK